MSKIKTQAQTNKEKFDEWMKKRVKSVFYSDDKKMCRAYERIIEY